jgi:hypothetical protein
VRKGPTIALMIGMPHGEEGPGQDEDNIDREQGNDDDIAEQGILGIAECLLRDGPPAIRLVRLLARGLEDMAQAAIAKDHHALEEAAGDACDAMRSLIED